MINKNQIIHDITMLYLEETIDFQDIIMDAAQLAIEYDLAFENVKDHLLTFELDES